MTQVFRNIFFMSCAFMAALNANAATVELIGGVADPYNIGIVPVPPNEPIPFTDADVSQMSDGNATTGFIFTSNAGDFSSAPYSVVGFGLRFDFDISMYSSIQQIDFTWTGKYTWEGGNGFPSLRYGPNSSMPVDTESFGTTFTPDNLVHTVTVSFTEGSTGFDNLANVLYGDRASYWVATDLGFSTAGSTLSYISIETRALRRF